MEIKDLTGLSKPLTRLIEVTSDGIGTVFRPYLVKKHAEAKAQEIRLISESLNEVAENNQLPVVYEDGRVELWQKPEDNTLDLNKINPEDRAYYRRNYQERKRQRNVENVTSIAATELAADEDVAEEKPDEDWITRFFNIAEEITSEQMQELWGRILAGEIKKPGSYSLRTLEFIRNLKPNEADVIESLGKLAIYHSGTSFEVVHDEQWLNESRQIYKMHFFKAGEIGAMHQSQLIQKAFIYNSVQQEAYVHGEHILVVDRGELTNEINLPIWKFTNVGQEVLSLIMKEPDDEYLEKIGNFFVKNGAKALIGRILNHYDDGSIQYETIHTIND